MILVLLGMGSSSASSAYSRRTPDHEAGIGTDSLSYQRLQFCNIIDVSSRMCTETKAILKERRKESFLLLFFS